MLGADLWLTGLSGAQSVGHFANLRPPWPRWLFGEGQLDGLIFRGWPWFSDWPHGQPTALKMVVQWSCWLTDGELCWVVCVCLVVSCSPHPLLYVWRLDCWFNTLQLSPLPLFIFESMISWDLCVFRPIVMEWPPQASSWLCNASHFLYYFSTGSNCKSIWWICYCCTWV